jgi:hypothetical protein
MRGFCEGNFFDEIRLWQKYGEITLKLIFNEFLIIIDINSIEKVNEHI